jgi:2-oxoglutarate ferredoxin oxidoreductase subunit alpha
MQKKFLWKIGGEAGFGIMTTGLVFSKIASRLGCHIYDYVQYPSLIRGGHNTYDVLISNEEVHSLKWEVDLLVCLDKETFRLHKDRLSSSTYIVFDSEDFQPEGDYIKVDIPFNKIIKDIGGQPIMKNTIALGVSLALLKADIEVLNKIIEKQFNKKGEEVINFNKKFAQAGYDSIIKNYSSLIKPILTIEEDEPKLIMSGNDAFSLGSVIADCRLYAAYPMTPSSSVLATLAAWQEKTGMIVRHAEDEIAVINTALGSSFAGARSAVGTSGGGFALMVESVALTGITEIPIVIFLAQRPGPATGMPTWTEQGDLLFAVHAGHGEFPKIVLAPGDIYEMIELTTKAFNLADIYQTPVIILSDMLLSEAHKSMSIEFIKNLITDYKVNRGKIFKSAEGRRLKREDKKYLRYQITEDGVSPMLIPGRKGYFYQANSYEHLEDSHTTEEAKERVKQVDKRNRKRQAYINNDFKPPKVLGDLKKADIIFVSWGSTKGVILEAQKILEKQGRKIAFIRFSHIYPLDEKKIKPLFSENKRCILIENNSQAQFGKLLQQETGIEIKEKLLKYDGRPFWPEEIVKYVKR